MTWNQQPQPGWGAPQAQPQPAQGGWGAPAQPQSSGNYDDLLSGGKATKSASFKGQFPIRWEGKILDASKKPAYAWDPSKPNNRGAQKFWDDGNPVENLWITLQTDVRESQEDDGRRVLVLDSRNKVAAVQDAVRESGASFAQGGHLAIEWYGNDANGKNPDNPPKLYRAHYTGPTFDAMLATPQQAAAQNAPSGWGQAHSAAPAPQWGGQAPAPTQGGWGQQAPAAPPTQGGWGAPQATPAPAPAAPPAAPPMIPVTPPAAAPAPSDVHPGLAAAIQAAGYPVPADMATALQMAAALGLQPPQ